MARRRVELPYTGNLNPVDSLERIPGFGADTKIEKPATSPVTVDVAYQVEDTGNPNDGPFENTRYMDELNNHFKRTR